jgi:ABC-2 type transport system ATP-binding protein
MDIFTAEKVTKQFANHRALNKVSISVPKQSIFGLLGPNGAGKTTFIRIINQITAPDEGKLFFTGEKLMPKHVEFIGYLPEERGLYKKMKVGEQAIYLARLKGISKTDAVKKLKNWFEKFDILNWWNRKVEELSKGMQQKIQFIITILHQPELLIFDEPFSGFDPINVNILKDEILNLRENGATIIFSTHNMSSVEELCDHIALIDNAEKILDGQVNEIKQQYKSNTFEIIFDGFKGDFNSFLNPEFEIVSNGNNEDTNSIKIRIPDKSSPNELIQNLLPHLTINSFNEIIPTMNEIFIKKVNENAGK